MKSYPATLKVQDYPPAHISESVFSRKHHQALITQVADTSEIHQLVTIAAGIGNNLNQITRYLHSGGKITVSIVDEIKKCITEVRELRREIVHLGGIYGNPKTLRSKKR